jgi:hypothetical protein
LLVASAPPHMGRNRPAWNLSPRRTAFKTYQEGSRGARRELGRRPDGPNEHRLSADKLRGRFIMYQ